MEDEGGVSGTAAASAGWRRRLRPSAPQAVARLKDREKTEQDHQYGWQGHQPLP